MDELSIDWQGGGALFCAGLEIPEMPRMALRVEGGMAVIAASVGAAAAVLPEPWRSAARELAEVADPRVWQLRTRSVELGRRTLLMGILNVTPDSFSDGGRHTELEAAIGAAKAIAAAGADILDVGGESTRPGSSAVDLPEEERRVLPLLEALAAENYPLPISVDTQKWPLAREALRLGAEIVNDVSAGSADPQMLAGVARAGAGIVLMHGHAAGTRWRGGIAMQDYLRARAQTAIEAGVRRGAIALDPGIGFGKRPEESYAAMRRMGELRALGYPVLFGPSRKRFLEAATGRPVAEREYATAAAVALAVALGADIVRVHAVAEMRDAVQVADRAVRG